MDRRQFVKGSGALLTLPFIHPGMERTADRSILEWRTYEVRWGGGHSGKVERHVEQSLMPSLEKLKVQRIGVFKEASQDQPTLLHMLIPYQDGNHYLQVKEELPNLADYNEASAEFFKSLPNDASYNRYSSQLLLAFAGMPEVARPHNNPERMFELRIYEGHNEDAVRRKIAMFNQEEIALFLKVNLLPVFFGEAIAGKYLPNLTYMLSFENESARDEHWKTFIDHPEWKAMSAKEEYANSVSNIRRTFLYPTSYSQI